MAEAWYFDYEVLVKLPFLATLLCPVSPLKFQNTVEQKIQFNLFCRAFLPISNNSMSEPAFRLPDKHWVGQLVIHPCVLLNFCLHFDWIFNQPCLPVRKGARLLGSQSSICFGAQTRNHGIRNTFSHPCIFPSHTMFQPGSHWLCQAIHNTILKHGIVIHIMFYFWMIHKNLKYGWKGNPGTLFWKC